MNSGYAKFVIPALVIVILIVVAFSLKGKEEKTNDFTSGDFETRTERVVTGRVFNDEGRYIVTGEVEVPTPCHEVEASAEVSEGEDEVVIALTTSRNEDEICAEVITSIGFRSSFNAQEDAEISATLDGALVGLNLIPVQTEAELGSDEVKG